MMQTFVRPSRDLRNHYAEISEMLKDHDHVIITNHGRGESVLINIEDYARYEEFLHQRYVAEALSKAKQQAADPDTQWADHRFVLPGEAVLLYLLGQTDVRQVVLRDHQQAACVLVDTMDYPRAYLAVDA